MFCRNSPPIVTLVRTSTLLNIYLQNGSNLAADLDWNFFGKLFGFTLNKKFRTLTIWSSCNEVFILLSETKSQQKLNFRPVCAKQSHFKVAKKATCLPHFMLGRPIYGFQYPILHLRVNFWCYSRTRFLPSFVAFENQMLHFTFPRIYCFLFGLTSWGFPLRSLSRLFRAHSFKGSRKLPPHEL